MTPEEIKSLAERIATGMATEEEVLLYNRLLQSLSGTAGEWHEELLGNRAELEAEMKAAIFAGAGLQAPVRRLWWRWPAAAAAMLLVGASYFLFSNNHTEKAPLAKAPVAPAQRFKNDVAPGQQGAILTLAGGQTIVLDSAANGALAQQGGSEVIKQNGQIVYKDAGSASEVVYNTMTTPRGRQYNLLLADGTRVWLNAASSITYPTAFVGPERKVSITGEAYFEVAHNAAAPFVVQKGDVQVQVLGTHFNVNAYEEESALNVTLLEGSVRVVKGIRRSDIRPGQQAQVKGETMKVVNGVNLEEVMAWKNGAFRFSGTGIETIMHQLERWYDVEVVYKKQVDDLFYAEIPRNTPLSDVLKALELTGEVRFAIEGKKVLVEGIRD